MENVSHRFLVGRALRVGDMPIATAWCGANHSIELSLWQEQGTIIEPDGELTCPKCQAKSRCLKGQATDADRILLAIKRPDDMLGPLEHRPCDKHPHMIVKHRFKWTREQSPKEALARITEATKIIDAAAETLAADEYVIAVDLLHSMHQRIRTTGPIIVDGIDVVIDRCFSCKINPS